MKIFFVLPYKKTNPKYEAAFNEFLEPFIEYLINTLICESEIIIVEQTGGKLTDSLPKQFEPLVTDNDKEFFNLGRTINIGYDLLKHKMDESDILFFHPIDLLPINANYNVKNTTFFKTTDYRFDTYKALAIKVSDYKKINGFSNEFWGWGWDDHDLFMRLMRRKIEFKNSIYEFKKLITHGNLDNDYEVFNPFFNFNKKFIDRFDYSNNQYFSGLHDLSYKKIDAESLNFLKKFLKFKNKDPKIIMPYHVIDKYYIL